MFRAGDFTVRIWDIDTSDNFVLPMSRATTTTNTNNGEHAALPAKGNPSVLTLNWTGEKVVGTKSLRKNHLHFVTI